MEKYRPYWIAATLIFLGLAFFRAYRKPRKGACATGSTCKQDAERRNKTLVWVVAVFIFALLALPYFIPFAFGGGPEDGAVPRQITLSVRNMTCSACVVTVKKSLTRVDGVKDVKVTLDPPRAAVLYDPTKIGAERLMEATTKAGFPSAVIPEGGR